jgi:PAS domain S-box-containing protein
MTIRAPFRFVLVILASMIGLSTVPSLEQPPAAERARLEGEVVVLLSYTYGLSMYEKAIPPFVTVMQRAGISRASLHLEFLDLTNGNGGDYRQNLATLLRQKYAGRQIALIVTVGTPAMEFLRTDGAELFPQVPVLDVLGTDSTVPPIPGRRIVCAPTILDYAGTVGLALQLFPRTRHVLVVSGASEIDKVLEREFRSAVSPWAGSLAFEYTSDRTLEETLQRVASPPSNSVVVFINYFADTTGRNFVSVEVGERLLRAARVPVFSMYAVFLDGGPLGGSMVEFESEGARAARTALDILDRKIPLAEPVTVLPSVHVTMLDARQLQKWGLSESTVPEGSLVVNGAQSSWPQFIPLVVLAIAIILIQSFWVAKLIVQQRRREAAEVALRESQTQLTLAIEGSRAGLWDWRVGDGTIILNDAWANLVGYSVQELSPVSVDTWNALCHPDDLTKSRALFEQHFSGKTPYYECEVRLRHKAGHWVWALGRGRITERNVGGAPVRVTGTHLDITQRKRLEADLIQAQKMESIGRLAGGVAHDFNNLLMAIGGNADLALIDVPAEHPAHQELKNIQLATRRAASLTRQLLTFARRQVVEPRVLNVNDVVGDLTQMLQRLIGEDTELVVHAAPETGWVRIDPGQIEQVLVNLVVNARDAMPEGGRIAIRTSNVTLDAPVARQIGDVAPGGYVSVAVSDTGAGMSDEVRAHIFEPFFTTKEPGKGTGLGLATCFGIVRQNQGHIHFASDPGRGTTFTVYLPRVDESYAPVEMPDNGSTLQRGTESILLAEDDGAVRATVERLLRAQGYEVTAVADAQAALDALREREGEFRLLVTDVIMPGMSGLKLVEEVQRSHADVKLLCVSGYPTRTGVEQLVSRPGVHFLQKPFGAADLATKVREALDS